MGSKSSEEVGENIRLWFAPWRKIFTRGAKCVLWWESCCDVSHSEQPQLCQLPTHHQHDMFDESDDESEVTTDCT